MQQKYISFCVCSFYLVAQQWEILDCKLLYESYLKKNICITIICNWQTWNKSLTTTTTITKKNR